MLKRAFDICRPLSRRPFAKAAFAVVALVALVAAGSASYSATLPRTITVRGGDTLWGIATANGLTVSQLAAANGMSPSDILLIGRRLVIPTGSPGPGAAAAAGPAAPGGQATFCADTAFEHGPWGVLPPQLQADPQRLALKSLMEQWAGAYGLNPALVEAIAWQESGWQEGVVSSASAVGVGQILPGTASFVQSQLVGRRLDINSANDNIHMMAAFLAYLVRQVGNNTCMVAAAYYQGPASLRSYGVFPESQQYVRDVIALQSRFE